MTRFFVPEHSGRNAERTYDEICRCAEQATGHRPLERRIAGIACRRDGVDLDTTVGNPDPVCGETVTAILDLGRHLPYLIHCGSPADGRQILIKKPVYAVTEFGR